MENELVVVAGATGGVGQIVTAKLLDVSSLRQARPPILLAPAYQSLESICSHGYRCFSLRRRGSTGCERWLEARRRANKY